MKITILKNCKIIDGELCYDNEIVIKNVKHICIGQYSTNNINYILYRKKDEDTLFLNNSVDFNGIKDHVEIRED